jgi:glycerophosphoryl diester phosphodiesterase
MCVHGRTLREKNIKHINEGCSLMRKIFLILSITIGILASACSVEKNHPVLKPPKHGGVYVVAHRGAHIDIPENSIPAYSKAIALGVDFVEVDIRTTKDGQFVSVHNREIDAYVPGASGMIKDFTLAELKAFDIGSRVGPEWEGTKIPTFEEILELCRGKCGIYLDLKEAAVEPLIDLVNAHGMTSDVLWYADDNDLEEVIRLCPECIIMPDPGPEKNLPALIDRLKPEVIAAVWKHYSRRFVETCHAAGAIVIVDEREPDCWKDALQWGSDGIQTDHPEELITVIEEYK